MEGHLVLSPCHQADRGPQHAIHGDDRQSDVTEHGRPRQTLNPATIACLTEPRIVDALFDGCGGLLILPQDTDSPQCQRLRARGVPFAMLEPGVMATIGDGSHVLVDERQVRSSNHNGLRPFFTRRGRSIAETIGRV